MTGIAGWLLGALVLVGLVSLVVVFQDRFIYFPLRYSTTQLQEARSVGLQEVKFRTTQGDQSAFFWRNEDSEIAPQSVWLLFGGNGDLALAWMPLLHSFSDPLSGYLLIDYPGYGICDGRPSPATIIENSERALETLLENRHWRRSSATLCVLGHSLGAAAALQFAAKNPVRKVLLVAAFTTLDDMVRMQIHIPLGPLLRHQFDNVASLKTILSKRVVPEICIFHGQADEIVPPKMGRVLAELDPERIKFFEVPGANHNNIFQPPLPLSLQSAIFDPPDTRR